VAKRLSRQTLGAKDNTNVEIINKNIGKIAMEQKP
jgi:hypothetical protein